MFYFLNKVRKKVLLKLNAQKDRTCRPHDELKIVINALSFASRSIKISRSLCSLRETAAHKS